MLNHRPLWATSSQSEVYHPSGWCRPIAAVQSVANQQNQWATIGRKDLALVGQFLIQELATYSG